MVTFPNAKINLGLNIIEKRTDGFHDIESCFYPIEWSDVLEVLDSDQNQFYSHGIEIPESKHGNLCEQAYQLLKNEFDLPPIQIHLLKNIPIGAGLGGGSSNGAFILKLLNEKYQLGLNQEHLMKIASHLGSDCPFFINNTPTLATGTGTTFEPIKISLKGYYILLVYPNLHISTAEAYAKIKPARHQYSVKETIENTPITSWKDHLINDFERSLFPTYPALQKIKNELYDMGALYASMTGSGSTIFGIFNEKTESPFPNYASYINILN